VVKSARGAVQGEINLQGMIKLAVLDHVLALAIVGPLRPSQKRKKKSLVAAAAS
jgi:hypothetical protein